MRLVGWGELWKKELFLDLCGVGGGVGCVVGGELLGVVVVLGVEGRRVLLVQVQGWAVGGGGRMDKPGSGGRGMRKAGDVCGGGGAGVNVAPGLHVPLLLVQPHLDQV